MIRVAVVDDKMNNRKVITDKLSLNNFFTVVFQAVNGEDFLRKMKELTEDDLPHIVLMDLEMPEIDGVAAIGTASSIYPQVKFVVVTRRDDLVARADARDAQRDFHRARARVEDAHRPAATILGQLRLERLHVGTGRDPARAQNLGDARDRLVVDCRTRHRKIRHGNGSGHFRAGCQTNNDPRSRRANDNGTSPRRRVPSHPACARRRTRAPAPPTARETPPHP